MKKILAVLLVSLFALSDVISETILFASDISSTAKESKQGAIAATDVASEVKVNANHVLLVNRGADSVYVRFNSTNVATTSDFELKINESVVLDSTQGNVIYNIQVVCAAADTADVRYLTWN